MIIDKNKTEGMRFLLVNIFLLLACTAYCQKRDWYSIESNIKGIKDGTKVSLTQEKDKTIIDSTIVANGKFRLRFPIRSNGVFFGVRLLEEKKSTVIPLLLDKKNVILNGFRDQLKNIEVAGSESHQDYRRFVSLTGPLKEEIRQAPAQSINNNAEDINRIPRLLLKIRLDFIAENPNSAYTPFLINTTSQLTDSAKKVAYNKLTSYARKSHYGIQLKNKLKAAAKRPAMDVSIGAKAPDFASTSPDGEKIRLYSIIKRSKLTLLDFWASWCIPCREENPYVKKVYDTFHEKGFNILSISFDFKEEPWKNAIAKDGMPWYHASDLKGRDAAVHTMYRINGIPDNFLIDQNGKIIARNLRGDDLYKKVQALLTPSLIK